MRGGHVHNKVLLPPVIAHCRALGASISLEHPVSVGARSGAVDMLADFGSRRLVVEAENSSRRVAWDIEKARQLGADALLILVPSARVAHACRREARCKMTTQASSGLEIYFMTLGRVHRWLSEYFLLFSPSIEASASQTIPGKDLHSSTPTKGDS
jgi:hypothetical protein